jgi:hypothetical protein
MDNSITLSFAIQISDSVEFSDQRLMKKLLNPDLSGMFHPLMALSSG